MTRDGFEKILKQIYETPFDEKRYLKHLFLDDENGIAQCRVILKKINQKINDTLARWDAAEDKSKVENSIMSDPSLYRVSEEEVSKEKISMAKDIVL